MQNSHDLIRDRIGEKFPQSCQSLVTSFTGRANVKTVEMKMKEPSIVLKNWNKNTQFLIDLIVLLSAILLHIMLIKYAGLFIQLIWSPWLILITTGRLRKFQVTHGHHLSHITIKDRTPLDSFLLEISCLIPWSQNYIEYKRDHNIHHTKASFTGDNDPDAALLLQLGFLPGLSKENLWKHLFKTFLNPSFHKLLIVARFRSNFHNISLTKLFYLGIHLGLLYHFGPYIFFLVVLVPWFPIYHISALLQFLSEHQWLVTPEPPKTPDEYAKRCWGRFLGEEPPDNSDLIKLIGWYLRIFLYHLPIRISVLVGDLPGHDWHHLVKNDPNQWVDFSELRTAHILKGEMPDQSFWGIDRVIDHVFEGLSNSTFVVG